MCIRDRAEEHLKALARKGAIEMIAGASRGIRLPESAGIPIVGRVAAGNPVLAEQNIEEYCDLAPTFFKPRADYFLVVQGDSMIEAGNLAGDLLAVATPREAKHRDIIFPSIEDEVPAQRLRQGGKKGLAVNVLHVADDDLLMPVAHRLVARPSQLAAALAARRSARSANSGSLGCPRPSARTT